MKKFILLFVAICSAPILFAQDVIVTVDEQQISAKILEISSSEVKYLDFNNQDGPVYVLSTQEILDTETDIKYYGLVDREFLELVNKIVEEKEKYFEIVKMNINQFKEDTCIN